MTDATKQIKLFQTRLYATKVDKSFFSKVLCLLLIFIPLLIPYKFPLTSYSFSTVLALLFAFSSFFISLKRRKKIKVLSIFFLLSFFVYCLFKSDDTFILVSLLAIIGLPCLNSGYLDTKFLRKTIEIISIVAALIVIFQTAVYYLFDIHIPFISLKLCTDSTIEKYSPLIKTGIGADVGAYRPSAFFLEPSHFAQFCLFGLVSCLFRSNQMTKKAILISAGIVATTSGMGILLTAATWLFWLLVFHRDALKKHMKMVIFTLLVFFAVGIALYQIPFVKMAFSRITGSSGEMSAIKGRLFWWDSYFGGLTAKDLTFGFGSSNLPEDTYFTGFMTYLYAFGIIGFVLFTCALIQLFFNSKVLSRYLILVFFLLTFFSNQTNIQGVLFNIGVILALKSECYA